MMMNPYQSLNSKEKILNCEGCNTVFASNIATPLATECGHFFCQEKCERHLKLAKTCLICQASVKDGSLKKEKLGISDFKYGNNKYLMAVLHPTKQIMLKREMDGSALLRDFIKQFQPIEQLLNEYGSAYAMVITHKQVNYKDVKDKSFDELKNQLSLIPMSQSAYNVNRIVFNRRADGGFQENQV